MASQRQQRTRQQRLPERVWTAGAAVLPVSGHIHRRRLTQAVAAVCLCSCALRGPAFAAGDGGVHTTFRFDPDLCHQTLVVNERGRRVLKEDGEDYQTILLSPPIPAAGRSFVEFEILTQAEAQCFMGMGVSKGTHEFREGRSAMAAADAWMLSTHSGKVYSEGGKPSQFLSGKGTPPFFPGDEHLAATSIRAREGDKVGLMADMDKRCLFVYINGQCQGAMAADLPPGLRFTLDLSDERQQVRIMDAECPPARPLQRHLLPRRLAPRFAEGGPAEGDDTLWALAGADDQEAGAIRQVGGEEEWLALDSEC